MVDWIEFEGPTTLSVIPFYAKSQNLITLITFVLFFHSIYSNHSVNPKGSFSVFVSIQQNPFYLLQWVSLLCVVSIFNIWFHCKCWYLMSFFKTQRYVRVYDLSKQELLKKLQSTAKWISSLAVHPKGRFEYM